MYPAGIFKYYDLFSIDGYIIFIFDFMFGFWAFFFRFFTLGIPLTTILHLMDGFKGDLTWEPIFPIFLIFFFGSWAVNLFGVEVDVGNIAMAT